MNNATLVERARRIKTESEKALRLVPAGAQRIPGIPAVLQLLREVTDLLIEICEALNRE